MKFNAREFLASIVFAFDDMLMEQAGQQIKAYLRESIANLLGDKDFGKSTTEIAAEKAAIEAKNAADKQEQRATTAEQSRATQVQLATNQLQVLQSIDSTLKGTPGTITQPVSILPDTFKGLDFLGKSQTDMLKTQESGFNVDELKDWGGSLDNILKDSSYGFTNSADTTIKAANTMDKAANIMSNSVVSMLSSGSTSGSSGSMFGGIFNTLVSGFSDSFGLSDQNLFGSVASLFGFANGGAFQVGGQGGTDSKLVQFMATPGEQVIVKTPEQQKESTSNTVSVTNHFTIQGNASRESQQQISAKVGAAIQRAMSRNN